MLRELPDEHGRSPSQDLGARGLVLGDQGSH